MVLFDHYIIDNKEMGVVLHIVVHRKKFFSDFRF